MEFPQSDVVRQPQVVLEDLWKTDLIWKPKQSDKIVKDKKSNKSGANDKSKPLVGIPKVREEIGMLQTRLRFLKNQLMAKMTKKENPWKSSNPGIYRCYVCVECDYMTNLRESFLSHARFHHRLSRQVFGRIKEQDESARTDQGLIHQSLLTDQQHHHPNDGVEDQNYIAVNDEEDNVAQDDISQDDVAQDDCTQDDFGHDDIAQDDIFQVNIKDDMDQYDIAQSDIARHVIARDDIARDDIARDDTARDDTARDDIARDDVARDDVAQDHIKKSIAHSKKKNVSKQVFKVDPNEDDGSPWQCYTCGKGLSDSSHETMLQHWQRYHAMMSRIQCGKPRSIFCEECGATFRTPLDLSRHNLNMHIDYTFYCGNCKRKSRYKAAFEHHLNNISSDGRCPASGIKCDIIKKNNMPSSKNRIKCDKCDKTFINDWGLKKHVKVIHDKIREHVCDRCGKAFGDKFKLDVHTELVHEEAGTEMCPTCGLLFGPKSLLWHKTTKHNRPSRANTGRYDCDPCGASFTKLVDLDHHPCPYPDSVLEGEAGQCSICFMRFKNRSALEIHKRRHESGVECPNCHKRFTANNGLTLHLKNSCSPDIPMNLQCSTCQKICKNRTGYMNHLQSHDPDKARRKRGGPVWHCQMCGLRFTDKLEFDTHCINCR